MLVLTSAISRDYPIELRASRKNDKYYVVAINGVAVHKFNKQTGAGSPCKLGASNKAALAQAGVGVSGDYIATR